MCLGTWVAKHMAEAAVGTLIHRFPNMRLTGRPQISLATHFSGRWFRFRCNWCEHTSRDGTFSQERAAIVGAGPVGCLAAQVLASRGFRVDLYDKRSTVEHSTAGRTINLSLNPHGMGALDRFGLRSSCSGAIGPDGGARVPSPCTTHRDTAVWEARTG